MQRRTLLRLGIGASVLFALAGGGVALHRPGLVAGKLSSSGRILFRAIASAVLEGSLPVDPALLATALDEHVARVDETIQGFQPPLQNELSLLVSLLTCAPGRLALTGLATDWLSAKVPEIHEVLQRMRVSSLAARQQVYLGLRELTNAAHYSDSGTWPQLGYPGPNPL